MEKNYILKLADAVIRAYPFILMGNNPEAAPYIVLIFLAVAPDAGATAD